ncbi:hypothetical protein BU17DRAFT_78326 [Hysterangium stoloniferum]|nr:hypothetical protein BU17DRAFT_78326 [Hysterangium stoloniferum]
MFKDVVQPPIISLFSSDSTHCLSLFSVHEDTALPSDSFVHILNDETSLPLPLPPRNLISPLTLSEHATPDPDDASGPGLALSAAVLHIQSPTLRAAYIQCPPLHRTPKSAPSARDLGLKLGWLHMHVRNMGREWSFEVGAVDQSGREGRIRCSTFQKQPVVVRRSAPGSPILHVPFTFPPASSRPLTAWCTVSVHIPGLMSYFTSLPSPSPPPVSSTPLPSGQFSHISFIRVYATCRLRRIWFTADRLDANEPWEFGLYSRS